MKDYAPYLMYQIARFGALSVPQMMRICDGVCKRSSFYRALSELVDGKFVYPMLNPATRTRAYYATKEGRAWMFGADHAMTAGVRVPELDHAILCADLLLELSRFENIEGISTPYEMSLRETELFCHERIPDGLFRLKQDGRHFEIALEVESTIRNSERIGEVLSSYWTTFKKGMPCSGLLIAALDSTIHGSYAKAISAMPSEFKERVRLFRADVPEALRSDAYGQNNHSIHRSLDTCRTSSLDEVTYSPAKLKVLYPKMPSLIPPTLGEQDRN